MTLNLTKDEIKDVTNKTHRKNQIIVLIGMGIPFKVRPDGSILVCRSAYKSSMGLEIKHEHENEVTPNFGAA